MQRKLSAFISGFIAGTQQMQARREANTPKKKTDYLWGSLLLVCSLFLAFQTRQEVNFQLGCILIYTAFFAGWFILRRRWRLAEWLRLAAFPFIFASILAHSIARPKPNWTEVVVFVLIGVGAFVMQLATATRSRRQ